MKQLTALSNLAKTSIANSGGKELSVLVPIDNIKLDENFEQLFPLNQEMVEKIAVSIEETEYDNSQPVHLWKERMILVDGHHRRLAAIKAGLKEIPVFYHHFENISEALEYAISLQTNRRNLSDAEVYKAMQTLDKIKNQGRISDSESNDKPVGKSAELTAKKIGVSRSKIEKARTVANKASDKIKKAVESGEMSINAAYNAVQNRPEKTEIPIILVPYTCELKMSEKQVKQVETFFKKENIKYSLVKNNLNTD